MKTPLAFITALVIVAASFYGCTGHAQTVVVTNAAVMPSFANGIQMVYDSVAGATNYGLATGFARATHGNRNVAFAEVAYNFNTVFGAIVGGDYLWTSKKSGVPSASNMVKGGLNLQTDLYPFKNFGLPNLKVTPFAFGLVATGNGVVSEILGGGAKTTIATWKGINVNLGVVYETRTGAGYWDGRYVGGFLAITKGF